MKVKLLLVLAIVATAGVIVLPARAKKDDLYEHYTTMSAVIEKIMTNYVEEVDRDELFYGAYEGMLSTLDPYSQFLPPAKKEDLEIDTRGEFGGLGIEITIDEHKVLTVITPLEGTPAFEAGVQAGDKIWKIDGEPTEGLGLREAVEKLRGPKGTSVTITVTHETDPRKPVDITIVRDIIKLKSAVDVRMACEREKVGYIRLTQFQENTVNELEQAIRQLLDEGMTALILDLRFNPGGLLNSAVEVADLFIDKGVIVSTRGRNNVEQKVYEAHTNATYHFPIALLVSGQSASASEIVAGALQDHDRAVIIGMRTYGKGSVQTIIPLENGNSAMRLTTAFYYTPSGRLIHRRQDAAEEDEWGIYPDIEVKTTPEDMAKLWEEWRQRHIEENTPEEAATTLDADAPDTVTEAIGETEEKPEPFVDRQLEAAKVFLYGELFRTRRAAN